MAGIADTAAWESSDWAWDAHGLVAQPAESSRSGRGKGGRYKPAEAEPKGGGGGQKGCCQVEGCGTVLNNARDYHSRYKICEHHLKAPVVLREGREQRFCQQCGKFQDVDEFDADKRSCRERLEKHNARRRRMREIQHMLKKTGKVDEELLRQKYGLSEQELAPKIQKLAGKGFPPAAAAVAAGAGAGEEGGGRGAKKARPTPSPADSEHTSSTQPSSSAGTSGGTTGLVAAGALAALSDTPTGRLLPIKTEPGSMAAPPGPGGADAAALLAREAAVLQKVMGMDLATMAQAAAAAHPHAAAAQVAGINVGADLDLLDDDFLDEVWSPTALGATLTPAAGDEASGEAAGQFLQLDVGSVMDLDDLAVLDELATEFLTSTQMQMPQPGFPSPAAAAPAAPPTINIPGLPPMPAVFPRGGGPPQVAPSVLAPSAFLPPAAARGAFGFIPPALRAAAPQVAAPQQHPFRFPGGLGGFGQPQPMVQSPLGDQLSTGSSSDQSTMVLDEALNLLAYDQSQVTYIPEETLLRFSAKLFNCTPAMLPPDLKASLVNMLSCNSIEGYIRPGCVHLTVDALMGYEERRALASQGVRAVVERLVSQQPQEFWREHTMLLQLGDKMCLVREGKVVHVLATGTSTKVFPRVAHARPLVATPAPESGDVEVALWGFNLGMEDDAVLARSQGQYLQVEQVSLDADPTWGGLQRLVLRVSGAAAGALQLEVMRGGFVSASKTLLVSSDAALAGEVRAMEIEQSATDIDTLMQQLGSLVALAAAAEVAEAGDEERSACGRAARRLLPFVLQRKWAAATQLVLACLAADLEDPREAMAQADVMGAGTTGMPILQLAVRSQSEPLVRALLAWGAQRGYAFNATMPGRRGLTALHLAALVADGGAIAGLLTEECPDALAGWESARCEDGQTPLMFAEKRGNLAIVERLIAATLYRRMAPALPVARVAVAKAAAPAPPSVLPPSPVKGAAAGAASSSAACAATACAAAAAADDGTGAGSSGAKGMTTPASMKEGLQLAAEEEYDLLEDEEDEVAAEKAAARRAARPLPAQSLLLTFRDSELEAEFSRWFNSGQVPVDIAFMVIAVLSQGAWIFRWSSDRNILALCMLMLMLVNGIMMQVAVLYPSSYSRRRQVLCLGSHVVHKVAQLVMTVLPPMGTVFSPTYNPTVAILESSGFAQVQMLSFGVKLRFKVHLAAIAFHLASALFANGSICTGAFPGAPVCTCAAWMGVWQLAACAVVPSVLVYLAEKRSRRVFLESVLADV